MLKITVPIDSTLNDKRTYHRNRYPYKYDKYSSGCSHYNKPSQKTIYIIENIKWNRF